MLKVIDYCQAYVQETPLGPKKWPLLTAGCVAQRYFFVRNTENGTRKQ
jgi:hypothetical protein